jgi:hypothetical protein
MAEEGLHARERRGQGTSREDLIRAPGCAGHRYFLDVPGSGLQRILPYFENCYAMSVLFSALGGDLGPQQVPEHRFCFSYVLKNSFLLVFA